MTDRHAKKSALRTEIAQERIDSILKSATAPPDFQVGRELGQQAISKLGVADNDEVLEAARLILSRPQSARWLAELAKQTGWPSPPLELFFREAMKNRDRVKRLSKQTSDLATAFESLSIDLQKYGVGTPDRVAESLATIQDWAAVLNESYAPRKAKKSLDRFFRIFRSLEYLLIPPPPIDDRVVPVKKRIVRIGGDDDAIVALRSKVVAEVGAALATVICSDPQRADTFGTRYAKFCRKADENPPSNSITSTCIFFGS